MNQAFATGATFFLQKLIDKRKLAVLFRAVRGTMVENRHPICPRAIANAGNLHCGS